jgi:hypothetical protein
VLKLHTYTDELRPTLFKKHVIESCQYLLRPIVRFLLRHGVTWREFSEFSKETYVDVARQAYGIDGRPTNNSRVAMLTGLSRREVSRVRDSILDEDASGASRGGNRMAQILTGWHADPEFVGEDGQPKDLQMTGPSGSLSSLLKRYAGDLPHGAIRKEMRQRGLLKELDNGAVRVLKRDVVYTDLDPEMVRQMGVALHDHAATLDHNLNDERETTPRFEGLADNISVSANAVTAFQDYLEERGLDFLQEVDSWLSNHEVDDPEDTSQRKIRLGVGVYLIHNEI